MASTRRFFFSLNERGELLQVLDVKGLIDGTRLPSGESVLRDRAFLDFFYLRLERTNFSHLESALVAADKEGGGKVLLDDGTTVMLHEILSNFTFVSVCGPEMNFLMAKHSPVVFTGYSLGHATSLHQNGMLSFGESMQEPFKPDALTITPGGKLFHPITVLKKLQCSDSQNGPRGLVMENVGKQFGVQRVQDELTGKTQYVLEWKGQKIHVPFSD
ncbi:putative protein of unknown function (DUF4505) [Trypanosoma vivax]|nr:putative protein of unknown function (DUF4505) [Trypanosoma vivax]